MKGSVVITIESGSGEIEIPEWCQSLTIKNHGTGTITLTTPKAQTITLPKAGARSVDDIPWTMVKP